QAGAVHRHGREAAALDQVDDRGPEPDLDRVRAHAEDDQAVAAERPGDPLDRAAEVARGEDVRQAGDQPAHRHSRLHRAAEARSGHQALPPGERPLVEMASATSPRRPSARTWRANTWS